MNEFLKSLRSGMSVMCYFNDNKSMGVVGEVVLRTPEFVTVKFDDWTGKTKRIDFVEGKGYYDKLEELETITDFYTLGPVKEHDDDWFNQI